MSDKKLSTLAVQLLNLLMELDKEQGYQLPQLGEHLRTSNLDELSGAAWELQDSGYVKVLEADEIPHPVVVLLPAATQAAPAEEPEPPKKSIISGASVGFGSLSSINSAASSTSGTVRTKSEPAKPAQGRGVIRTIVDTSSTKPATAAVSVAPAPAPVKAAPAASRLDTVSIKQILDAMVGAIESTPEITDKDKWPLVDKIQAISSHPAIAAWISAPLKNIIE